MDFWGLLISGKSSRSAISRPRPLHRRRSVGGRLQRFATWRNLLAVSSADRASKESPWRVSDRARWAGTSLCPHGMFFDGASKCGHRDVPAHLRRGPLTWVWADDCFHTLPTGNDEEPKIFLPAVGGFINRKTVALGRALPGGGNWMGGSQRRRASEFLAGKFCW